MNCMPGQPDIQVHNNPELACEGIVVNDELKNICQIDHSRPRSFSNFVTNMISGLIAYCFMPQKPAIKYETLQTDQLVIF